MTITDRRHVGGRSRRSGGGRACGRDWLVVAAGRDDYLSAKTVAPTQIHARVAPTQSESIRLEEDLTASLYDYWRQVLLGNNRRQTEPAARFDELRAWWKAETAFTASGAARFMHPAYQQIIGIGPEVLGTLLSDLRDAPTHWFWALSAISGEDPAQGTSTFNEARDAWLAWGAERGLIG